MIAVTGATGAVGGRVAARLAEAGLAQRLVVRDPRRAPLLPKAEVAEASYADAAAMRRALEGVGAFFMVSGAEDRDRLGQHKAAVDAAVEAGVERIVYLSFVAAAPETTFTFGRDHYHTEVHIRASGLGFAFLRDNWYQDMLPLMAGPDGVIRGPAGVGRVGAVSRDDVADAAAAVLLGGAEHDGRTYDVTGPEAITLHEAAEELTRATGRPVTYHAETVEEAYSSRSGYGAPDWMVEGWVTSYAAMADGDLDVVSDAVRDLTGHAPATFAEFLSRHPESYRHLAEQG
ncbi:NAD(P)H-binding protein [Rubrobacter marinus]|uniref:NAD(P)H-binding protein n=1 Tax=Rubrobacter marinus TaxID=2653852 RepID=UPI001A9F43C1